MVSSVQRDPMESEALLYFCRIVLIGCAAERQPVMTCVWKMISARIVLKPAGNDAHHNGRDG
jgi:hypothetical protein